MSGYERVSVAAYSFSEKMNPRISPIVLFFICVIGEICGFGLLSVAEAMGDAGSGGAHLCTELRDALGGHARECAADGDKTQLVKASSIVTARCADCMPTIGSMIAFIGRTSGDDRYR